MKSSKKPTSSVPHFKNGSARDIFVIGASAGGITALRDVLSHLKEDFLGSIFIVLHTSTVSLLPSVLRRSTQLPIAHAVDGQKIEPGKIIVAPPDQHLLLEDTHVLLSRGPKQNNTRPSIDPLFRSAGRIHGERVVGIVLSGMLDDGSAGLVAIKNAGGLAIVQDPTEAPFPSMPQNAMEAVEPDYVLGASQIGITLNLLAKNGKGSRMRKSSKKAKFEDMPGVHNGTPSMLTCPECGGTLWERHEGRMLRFACHTGHSFSAESMNEAQSESVEAAMWEALRSLKERAHLLTKLAAQARRGREKSYSADRYEKEVKELERKAEVIQKALVGNGEPKDPEPVYLPRKKKK